MAEYGWHRDGRAYIIDVHSYPSEPLPYELHGAGAAPAGVPGHGRLPHPGGADRGRPQGVRRVRGDRVDSPFAGTYVPLEFYGTNTRVGALMVEIRRDTYMTEPGGPAGPGLERLATALAALVDAL
ncbi:hypothetical protein GCM10017687_77630 [Streptomyces echinatus]|uniref:N-formylglutamate amidohydrolase n=1 Tax=Streptomyces echinatus TaxID=67293 RepID=UPI0031ECB91A